MIRGLRPTTSEAASGWLGRAPDPCTNPCPTGDSYNDPIVSGDALASSFAKMARQAEQTTRAVQVPKEVLEAPPLTIHTLGDQVLRQPAKRISKVDESVRELARDMLRSMYTARGIGLAAPRWGSTSSCW